jgi:flagellar protein FlaG
VKSATETLKQVIEAATGRQLDFTLNDRFRELVVKISDRKSGEVVKEIPSKEFMKLRERLNDLIGLFVDEKA